MNNSKYKSGDTVILTAETQGLQKGHLLLILKKDGVDEYHCSYLENEEEKYNNFFEDEFRLILRETKKTS